MTTALPPDVIFVPCSTQLLAEMEGDWSTPVEVKADRRTDGTYEHTMRRTDAHHGTVIDCEMCIPCPIHAPIEETP
jgi:predicted metalloendopeptidase